MFNVKENKALVKIRRSAFKLPSNHQRPIILIGAGTGVAPFRAFVQERAAMASHNITIGKMLLLFGCRSPD
jgi:NADPH-ferrihemoprotein reductase